MGRACLRVLVVLLFLVGTAHAQGRNEGRGFSLGIPAGFEKLTATDMQISPVHGIDLTARIAPPGAASRQVYVAGSILAPDALLLVSRIRLDRGAMGNLRVRNRYMHERIFLSKARFDGLVTDGAVELRSTEVDGWDALAMKHGGSQGLLGLEEPATNALVVVADDFLLVVVLMVHDTASYPQDATWAAIRHSITVTPPVAVMRSALLYGGVGLVGLLVLVLVARLMARRRRGPAADWGARTGSVLSSEGWGGGRGAASEGVPPSSPSPARSAETLPAPAPMPEPAPPPEPAPEPPAMPSPVPAPVAPPPMPVASEPVAKAAGAPPPLPPSEPPAPPPSGPPAVPVRKGLRSTLPANGRFSQ